MSYVVVYARRLWHCDCIRFNDDTDVVFLYTTRDFLFTKVFRSSIIVKRFDSSSLHFRCPDFIDNLFPVFASIDGMSISRCFHGPCPEKYHSPIELVTKFLVFCIIMIPTLRKLTASPHSCSVFPCASCTWDSLKLKRRNLPQSFVLEFNPSIKQLIFITYVVVVYVKLPSSNNISYTW